jgi:hypothetical protein
MALRIDLRDVDQAIGVEIIAGVTVAVRIIGGDRRVEQIGAVGNDAVDRFVSIKRPRCSGHSDWYA